MCTSLKEHLPSSIYKFLGSIPSNTHIHTHEKSYLLLLYFKNYSNLLTTRVNFYLNSFILSKSQVQTPKIWELLQYLMGLFHIPTLEKQTKKIFVFLSYGLIKAR